MWSSDTTDRRTRGSSLASEGGAPGDFAGYARVNANVRSAAAEGRPKTWRILVASPSDVELVDRTRPSIDGRL